jgi:NhaP-type Na+/H+ or K+/H+ antiporter
MLGIDDFLVTFGAGVGSANDGWFSKKTKSLPFPTIIDMMLDSSLFGFFGSIIPWNQFGPRDVTPHCGVWQLLLFLVLVLLYRRIPIGYAMKRFVPDLRTYREALFCGHFGPMGADALFLAIEARAELETGTSMPVPKPKIWGPPYSEKQQAIHLVWPVICFAVLGSTMAHGLSVVAISVGGHLRRKEGERAPLLGAETDPLDAIEHDDGNRESEPEVSGSEGEGAAVE